MPPPKNIASALEIDRLATQLAKDPHSKAFLPLAEEYCKAGMWEEAVSVLEDGLKYYPGFITAMVVLGRAYDQLNQPTKAKAVLEGAVKLSPENLRAHRTLTKIYAAQGLNEEALKSCRVILAMNPRDEEALSIQASLGIQEPEKSQPAVSKRPTAITRKPAASDASADSGPVAEPESVLFPTPNVAAGMTPVASGDQPEPASISPSSPSPGMVDSSAPRPRHAATIAQLESWLRSIQLQRRDRPAEQIGSSS